MVHVNVMNMKVSTLFTMDYHWAYRYVKKRTVQRVNFLLATKNRYDVIVGDIGVQLGFSTPYHHSIAYQMSHGIYEELPLMEDWVRYAKDAKVIFDVGGFNGIYGLLAKKA